MAQDEEVVLLQRFVTTGDAAAFSDIVRRHIGLVYSTCMRILADRDKAADATQETFFQFLKKANNVTGSVPAWLHRVATCKAVDAIRTESSRRRAEGRYADVKFREATKWEDLSPYVDQALDALDDPTRDLLIEYFYEGQSVTNIAADKAISRTTVSKRLKAAVDRIRRQLRKRGIVVAAFTISSLLSENAAQAVPTDVLHELAKMTLAGGKLTAPPAATVATASVAGGLLLAAKAKVVVVAVAVCICAVGVLTHRHFNRPPKSQDTTPITKKTASRPNAGPVSPPPVVESQEQEPAVPTVSGIQPEARSPMSTPDQPVADTPVLEQQSPETTAQTQENRTPKLDLSSPEATVRTFIKCFVAGDAESVLACCLPDGTDYEDIQEILFADPADPQQRDEYQFRLWFQSLDPDAEMPIISKEETPRGISVTWLVTFKTEFAMPGRTFAPGEQMELDGTVVQSDGKWLIDGI